MYSDGAWSKSKRIRLRQNCSYMYCGVNLGKSSYYEHIYVCPRRPKTGKSSDSDDTETSPFTVDDLDQQEADVQSPTTMISTSNTREE